MMIMMNNVIIRVLL